MRASRGGETHAVLREIADREDRSMIAIIRRTVIAYCRIEHPDLVERVK
jgi:hypothetical protein